MTMTRGFEWFIAWRHLRAIPNALARKRAFKVGLVLALFGVADLVLIKLHGTPVRDPYAFASARPNPVYEWLHVAGVVDVIVAGIVMYAGRLFARFTLFTAISIFGVFLGTAAPIVALSVMSGFEADLKARSGAPKRMW